MTATVAQLGARALRKLGVSIVAYGDASRPGVGPTITASEVAAQAVRQLGIVVPESERPVLSVTVTLDHMAADALRAVGVNPIYGGSAAAGVATVADIAARSLLLLGVNPENPSGAASGTTATKALIGTRTLLKLGVIASDEAPSGPDQAEAETKVSSVHDMMVKLGVAVWAVDAVPDRAIEAYIIMAANLLAPEFGKPGSAEAFAAGQEMLRVQALSGLTAQIRAQNTLENVHQSLASSAMIDWDLFNVPASLAEAYATMTAQLLAPMFGKPQDMGAYDMAEGRVRRVALSGARGQALALSKTKAVHDALIAVGIVSWTADQVPLAFSEDYVALTAVRLAPVMGRPQTPADRQADQAAWDAAEGRIRRAALIQTAQDRAVAKVRATFDELASIGMVDFDISAIPASMGDSFAGLAAASLGPDFGKEETPAALEARWTRIRMIAMGGPAGQKLAEQKVIAAFESLAARGRARFILYDLPVWAEEPLVFMAATWLAPEVGVKADPAWWVGAEVDLMRIVSVPTNYEPVWAIYY